VSRDVTALLLGTVYHPSAGTSYGQHVSLHQIWSQYVYSLRRYEGDKKCKIGIVWGL